MMNALLIVLALATDPATCPMHAEHMKQSQHSSSDVDTRGDHVMGFSHEKTTHAFRVFADGGAVEVRANDEKDAESIAAIRSHLQLIAKEFADGDFAKPQETHARVPDGVPVMKALGAAIEYRYEELERGGRVRITTRDRGGIDAVHAFMRFQIRDHHTADPGKVE
jgi:hypothetical protein